MGSETPENQKLLLGALCHRMASMGPTVRAALCMDVLTRIAALPAKWRPHVSSELAMVVAEDNNRTSEFDHALLSLAQCLDAADAGRVSGGLRTRLQCPGASGSSKDSRNAARTCPFGPDDR
ncbi:hypothetical protein L602_001000000910 [Cupriavidus gilardii J11]|uniref:Uncharacterized protein n=1 Tax=Cupriavidus gilardii J11 TaxID=936133 RepID=A0A562BUN1_9BURK|nr:hypothetical protein L602_001000000910 [Cupriavidus gilardii J11]